MYSAQRFKLTSFFLFVGKIPCNHGEKQLHSDWLHPGGLHDRPQGAAGPLCGLPWCLFYDCARNTTFTVSICNDSRLHTPTYFFTGTLTFLDLWYSSIYTPKIPVTCISEDKSISLACWVAQVFFSGGLGYNGYLLAAMAYDRYVAISEPLVNPQAMSIKPCALLAAASHLGGFVNCSTITKRVFTMNFCNDNIIDDVFCDFLPLVKLACGTKGGYQDLMYYLLASSVITPAVFAFACYLFIITILRIRSTQGRLKAVSTCSPRPDLCHLVLWLHSRHLLSATLWLFFW